MKVRKLAVALALAGGLGSGVAQALGLGEVELRSYLNEPLNAHIVLRQSRGVSPSDVFVNVASESAYQRVGLNRGQFASKLTFQVVTRSDGSLAVSVSSREPLREPYLNFLLELTWPSGRLLREYAVLVDPPVYAAESGTREPLVAPSSAGRGDSSPGANSGAVSRSAPAGAGSGSAQSLAPGSVYGPTTSSDTLWGIATRMRPNNSVSVQQVMLAIQDLNPDAFIGGNINRLKRGEVLRVPTLGQIQRLGQGEAIRVVRAQNQDANTNRATIDARPAVTPSAPAATDGGDAELKLIVAETEALQAVDKTEQSGSAGTDGNQADGADAGTAIVLEQLDSARRENSELNTRVDSLQEQMQTLQRLLELKNNQLADLQQADINGESAVTGLDQNAAESAAVADGGASASAASEPAAVAETGDAVNAANDPAVTAGDDVKAQAEVEPAAEVVAQPQQDAQPQVTQPDPVEESLTLNGLVKSVVSNPLYQIVLGAGLLLLLLLLLVSRRKSKNRDAAENDTGFEQAPPAETASRPRSFDLNLDDHELSVLETGPDVLAEVDSYLAYGQHEQAANTLEFAISREPSRLELRLKLLAVYADTQNRVAFERQYGELSALDVDEAMAEADRLLTDLEQAEAEPSIDDLESELRSGSFGSFDEDATDSTHSTSDSFVDYDLTTIEGMGDKEEPAKPEAPEDYLLSDDFALEFADEDAVPPAKADESVNATGKTSDDDDLSLDEAFLDDLDAELDKVDPQAKLKPFDVQEPDLGKLEPDLDKLDRQNSDDDLVLMSELADSAGSTRHASGDEAESKAEELGVKVAKTQGDEDDISLDDLETLGLLKEDLPAYDFPEGDLWEDDLPEADLLEENFLEEEPPIVAPGAPRVLNESDLGGNDDFDFLTGTDEAATKLDLAQAYVEMGDVDGARDMLMEVELEGTAEQKAEAKELLNNLS